ncbi:MAG TPA: vitamin B12-dependent ribonucleotide reductase, partial [Candidatus Jacksonbacteria bacterium]|nr:vitamin B12-dependent ribonucleotide reductase [Candidatus Jacksonbacteria bacterium]HCR15553.1 vitamin B12-dependent ribonucleotide reductase [Candidatus Jacksonbacteria bacterium]
QEIQDIYWQTWQLGLKAVALYRDGCKLSQPLSSATSDQATETTATLTEEKIPLVETSPTTPVVPTLSPQSKQLSFIERGTKKDLPNRRKGVTIEATVAGHKLFLRTGEYEDGKLGEIFIDMHKEGAAFRSLLNCFAIAVSLGLQYGVPLKKYVDKFTFTRFEPNGVTDHPNIKTATSIIDFIFRILGMEFLNRFDFVHVLPEKAMNPMEING